MPFEKNKSGNPQGRKPGSKNKVTQSVKQLLEAPVNRLLEDLEEKILPQLNAVQKANLLCQLLKYIVPVARDEEEKDKDTAVGNLLKKFYGE